MDMETDQAPVRELRRRLNEAKAAIAKLQSMQNWYETENKMQSQVREFHCFYGVNIGTSPQLLTLERNHLRLRLITEEAEELAQAMMQNDLVECADALGDLLYVVFGCAVEMGLDMQEIVDEIHRSNLSKLGANGKPIQDGGGKILKGPNYSAPDIASVIATQKERKCR